MGQWDKSIKKDKLSIRAKQMQLSHIQLFGNYEGRIDNVYIRGTSYRINFDFNMLIQC